ncbi:MAG TPA: FtsQ-type POTRA domain-containing protein [Blastocatellia bacterium]|nr:FtsQ-type POTRA domain-containing protein [Blastocatellia bacterium]
MSVSPHNENKSYSNMAERHQRRNTAPAAVITGVRTTPGRRRGLPEDFQREEEERAYQARYERELQERRQQRAAERREARQREIVSKRPSKRALKPVISESSKRWTYLVLIVLITLILLIGSVMAYNKVTGSQLFTLKQIELQGAKRASAKELLRELEAYKARSLWQLDLQTIRTTLEKNPWVLEADVSRVLPDSLRITIHEREPVAPWHSPQGQVVWVDREARRLGELDFNQMQNVPPIINGLEEGTGEDVKAGNQRRMETYQRLMNELDQGGAKLSEEIDEVNLKDVQAVRLHLLKRKVSVMVGGAEFRPRLEKAIKVLEAIERKDVSALGFFKITDAERLINGGHISYLNVTHPERVIVGLE